MKTRLGVVTLLARDTTPHASYRLAPGLGYRLTAIFTIGASDATREGLARVLDRISDTLVDLVLYCAIARPPTCHDSSSCKDTNCWQLCTRAQAGASSVASRIPDQRGGDPLQAAQRRATVNNCNTNDAIETRVEPYSGPPSFMVNPVYCAVCLDRGTHDPIFFYLSDNNMTTLKTYQLLLLAGLVLSNTNAIAKGGDGIDDNPSADDLYVLQFGAEKEDNSDIAEMTESEIESLESESPATPPLAVTPPSVTPPSATGNQLVDAWLAPNSGIIVNTSSINYIGDSNQGRVYGAAEFGTVINSGGIVLTTGSADFGTTNTSSGYTHITGTGASFEVSSLSKQWTYDKNQLSFSFTAAAGIDAVTTKFMFASEEYPEWTGIFRDGFALLVDGVNVARFDPSNFVVLDNCSSNGVYPCTDTTQNDNGFFSPNQGASAAPFEFDGYTAVLTATGLLDLTRSSHDLKVVIADSNDPLWDSAVFLSELRGLSGTQASVVPVPAPALLMGSALAGLFMVRRRNSRA